MAPGKRPSDAYTATLTRLEASKGNRRGLGLQALTWVLPKGHLWLRSRHALGVEMGSAELDPENIPALPTLLASCLGLPTIEAFSPAAQLARSTLQGHLTSDPALFNNFHSIVS